MSSLIFTYLFVRHKSVLNKITSNIAYCCSLLIEIVVLNAFNNVSYNIY